MSDTINRHDQVAVSFDDLQYIPNSKHVVAYGSSGRLLVPVSFKNISYSVKHQQHRDLDITILSDVSGFFKPGQMSALMGPSGSGKTTLLDILAGRKTTGTITGDIRFGAQGKPSPGFLKRHTGYVEQTDTLLETLTVEEMVMYTAELKLVTSRLDRQHRVQDMIEKMHLNKCRDTLIGSQLARGISGGQAKRVNIAISLITDPAVLFLDEPTSGLDSHTAMEVMEAVKEVATDNRTICATIHSPSVYTFRQFDSLMLLLEGQVVYFGPNGDPAINHFTSAFNKPFYSHDNEAEWIVNLSTAAAKRGDVNRLAEAYQTAAICGDNKKAQEQLELDMEAVGPMEEGKLAKLMGDSGTTVGFFKSVTTLVKYRTLRNYCSSEFLGARCAEPIMVVFILATLYAGRGDRHSPKGVQDISGMLFVWVTLASFGAMGYVPSLVMERALFYREQADGLYTVAAYFFVKVVEELFISFTVTGILAVVVYFAVQLQGSFFLVWLTYSMTLATGISAAYAVAALSRNMDIANVVLPAYMVSLIYFTGLVMNFSSIPKYWEWYSRINFVRYGFTALLVNQFENAPNAHLNGEHVLDYFDVAGENKWANLGYECAFFVFFTALAYILLCCIRHDKR